MIIIYIKYKIRLKSINYLLHKIAKGLILKGKLENQGEVKLGNAVKLASTLCFTLDSSL